MEMEAKDVRHRNPCGIQRPAAVAENVLLGGLPARFLLMRKPQSGSGANSGIRTELEGSKKKKNMCKRHRAACLFLVRGWGRWSTSSGEIDPPWLRHPPLQKGGKASKPHSWFSPLTKGGLGGSREEVGARLPENLIPPGFAIPPYRRGETSKPYSWFPPLPRGGLGGSREGDGARLLERLIPPGFAIPPYRRGETSKPYSWFPPLPRGGLGGDREREMEHVFRRT
jgi:hypothetical protein